jgi:hypothetical protein
LVEFVLDKWKKVVIHEINKFDLDSLFKLHALGSPRGGIGRPLLWANGVVFDHNNMPPTTDIVKGQMEGTIHWSSLQFGFMPKYKDSIVVDSVTVHIGNVGANKLFFEMADWLKKTYKET